MHHSWAGNVLTSLCRCVQELFSACVDYNPSERPSFEEILDSLASLIEEAEMEKAAVPSVL